MDLMGIAGNAIRKWSSAPVTVGRGEDAQCRWGRKLVREEKSEPFWRELMDRFVGGGEGVKGGRRTVGRGYHDSSAGAGGVEIRTVLEGADGRVRLIKYSVFVYVNKRAISGICEIVIN
jgi:hypothetical protein